MSLLKPTADTLFHIDFDWWKNNERDWHVFLRSLLCPEHQESLASIDSGEMIDWIDPDTAEIKSVDGVQHVLMSHCALRPDFTGERTALVEAIFRIFLVNGNIPMPVKDIAEKLGRPLPTILKTISGPRVYRGLRPYQSQDVEVSQGG